MTILHNNKIYDGTNMLHFQVEYILINQSCTFTHTHVAASVCTCKNDYHQYFVEELSMLHFEYVQSCVEAFKCFYFLNAKVSTFSLRL